MSENQTDPNINRNEHDDTGGILGKRVKNYVWNSGSLSWEKATASSGGGGTEYTDGATPPANPVGGTIEWNEGGTWRTVSTAKPLPVTASVSSTPPTDVAPATQNITVVDSGSSTTTGANNQSIITGSPTANSTASFSVSSEETITVQITGTWTGTLSSEVSFDAGTTWYTRGLHQIGTNYSIGSVTANAQGIANVSTATNFRIRAAAAMTGTATVKIIQSVNPAAFYLINSPQIADGTTPAQKLAIDSSGRIGISTVGVTATSLGKAEDAPHASGDTGVMSLAVRNDTGAVLAGSDGDYIPFTVDSTGALRTDLNGTVSTNNSSTATLTANSVFTGTSDDALNYNEIRITVWADQASATNGLSVQQSTDNSNWDVTDVYTIAASIGKTFSVPRQARYIRVVYTNGGTNQGAFRLQTLLNRLGAKSSSQRTQDGYSNENDLEEVWAFNSVWNGTTHDRMPGDTTGVRVKQRADTATLTNVAASASSVTLLSANTARIGAQITNDSSAVVYIKFGTTASTTSYTVSLAGAVSAPFSYYEVPAGYTGRIDAIWASATGNARITEET